MPPKKTAAPPPHQKSDAIKPGTTFRDNNKRTVTVGKELAQGGFGRICDVKVDDVSGQLIGKFEPGGNGPLFVEQSVFTRILRKENLDKFAADHKLNFLGLPYVVSNGMYNDIRYLVMPKYSHCLDHVIKKKGSLPVKNAKQVLHCVLNALEYMHRNDYAHADIKAGNIMMNSEAAFDQVYLIDFGLCMRADKAVDKDNKKRAHNGTPFFTSTDAHRGIGPTYRGDIEILAHNLVYWLSGKIPWEKHENSPDEIFNAKKALISNLDKGLSQLGITGNEKELIVALFKEAARLGATELPDFKKLHSTIDKISDGTGKPKGTTRKEKVKEDLSETKEEPVKRGRGRRNEEPVEEPDADAESVGSRRRNKQKKPLESVPEDVVPSKASRITKDRRTTTESDDEAVEKVIPGLNKNNRPPTATTATAAPASSSKVVPGMKGRTPGSKRKADESTLSAKPRSRSNRLLESEVVNRQSKPASCRTVTPPPRHFPVDARSLPRPEKKPICRVDVIDGSPDVDQAVRHRSARLRSISPDYHPPSKAARSHRPSPSNPSFETPQSSNNLLRSILPSSIRTIDTPISKSTPIRRGRVQAGNSDDLENTSPEYRIVRVERPTGMKAILVLLALFAVSCLAEDANAKLKKCCAKIQNEDEECVNRFCDFDSISQTNVLNYLSTCTERGGVVGKMWDCASSRVDHTACCKAKGVEGKCLEYCAAHDGVPTNYLNYLTCLENFNEIRDCFKDHIEKH